MNMREKLAGILPYLFYAYALVWGAAEINLLLMGKCYYMCAIGSGMVVMLAMLFSLLGAMLLLITRQFHLAWKCFTFFLGIILAFFAGTEVPMDLRIVMHGAVAVLATFYIFYPRQHHES